MSRSRSPIEAALVALAVVNLCVCACSLDQEPRIANDAADASVDEGPGAVSATRSTVTLDRHDAVADGDDAITITITLVDADGRPIPDEAVTLATTGAATLSTPVVTDANGSTTAAWTSKEVETATLTVSAGGVELTAHPTAHFSVGPAAQLAFAVPPSVAEAGDVIAPPVQVRVEDARGRLVTTEARAVTLTLSEGELGGTSTVDAVAGFATFSDLSIARAGSGYTLTATSGALALATSDGFDIRAGPLAKAVFTTQPTTTSAGASMTPPVQVSLVDAEGNVIPTESRAVTVAIGTHAGPGTLSGAATVNVIGGTATFPDLSIDRIGADYTLVVTSGGFVGDTSAAFDVVPGAPSATFSSLTGPDAPVVADGASSASFAVTVVDANANPIAGEVVSFEASGTNGTFSATTCTTGSDGACAVALSSTTAQTQTITATFDGVSLHAEVTFVPGPVSIIGSTFTASTTMLVAGDTTTLTLKVVDAHGNPKPDLPVTLAASGSGSTLTPDSGTTDAQGGFVATLRSTIAQTETVTAHVGAANPLELKTDAITFAPGAVSGTASTVVVAPSSIVVGDTAMITVTVLDDHGNAVPDVAIALTTSRIENTLTPPSGSTDMNGVFVANVTSTKAQTDQVLATVGEAGALMLESASFAFVAGAPSTTASSIAGPTIGVPADGATPATLLVTVLDANQNPVPDELVTFQANGTNNVFSSTTCMTGATGTCFVVLTSTTAQDETVTATFGSVTLSAPVSFVPGVVSVAYSTVTASPLVVVAGTSTTTLTVTLVDTNRNPAPDVPVTLTASGLANTFTPPSGTTDTAGVFTATLSSTVAQTESVTAYVGVTSPAAIPSSAITFVPGAPDAGKSSVSISASSVTAGDAVTVTVTVHDANGNVVPDANVDLMATGGANTFASATGQTDSSGVFVASLTSTLAQTKTVSASFGAGPETAGVPITFVAGAPSDLSTVTASPSTFAAGEQTTLIVTARDAYGNVVPNVAVALSADGQSNTITEASGTTDALGVFTATLASEVAQSEVVTATIGTGGMEVVSSAIVIVPSTVSAPDSTVVLGGSPLPGDGATQATVTVTAVDAYGNPQSGAMVVLAVSPAANTSILPQPTQTANAAGVAIFPVTATSTGDRTFTATVNGQALSTTPTLSVINVAIDAPVAPGKVSGAMNGCTTAASNTSRKIDVDAGNTIYLVMNCAGTGYVVMSRDGGATFTAPMSTGITGITGSNELQIVAGAEGEAHVVGYSGASTVLHSRTTDAGATWSGPTTITTTASAPYGVAYPNVAVRGASVWVAAVGSDTQIYRNDSGGAGAFPLVGTVPLTFPQSVYWRLFVDDVSGKLYLADESNDLFVTVSDDAGATWGPVLPIGTFQGARSSWAVGGGFLYNAGWKANATRISLADVDEAVLAPGGTSVPGTSLTGTQPSVGDQAAIDADTNGNAYFVSTSESGLIGVQGILATATAMGPVTPVVTSGGTQPVIRAGPKGAVLVAWTQAGAVHASVVVPQLAPPPGAPITSASGPVKISGGFTNCSTAVNHLSQKLAIDEGHVVYALMNCNGTAYVATSLDGGASFGAPVSTGLSGIVAGTHSMQIAAGAHGTAWVAAYTSGNAIRFAFTNNGGGTWSKATTIGGTASLNQSEYGLVNLAARGSHVWVAYNTPAGTQLYENVNGGAGPFTFVSQTSMPNAAAVYWRLFVDGESGHLYDVGETNDISIAASSTGVTWSPTLPVADAVQGWSTFDLAGGWLYNAGGRGAAYRIATSDIDEADLDSPAASSVPATRISGVLGQARHQAAIAADGAGNAYVVMNVAGKVSVQALQVDIENAGPPGTVVASGASDPNVLAGQPGTNAALVTYTQAGAVHATVVIAPTVVACEGETPDGCEGACTNMEADDAHCGACNNACPANQTCMSGECRCSDASCGGTCVDTQNDPNNCGGCGNVCGAENPNCQGGQCVCRPGASPLTCAAGNVCVDANQCGCPPPSTNCNTPGDVARCVDFTKDTNSECGACNTYCKQWEHCIDGRCYDFGDQNNCGGVGNVCPGTCYPQPPKGGYCLCGFSAQTFCPEAGVCADLFYSSQHCGACGVSCTVGEGGVGTAYCVGGVCKCSHEGSGAITCKVGATATTSCRALGQPDPNACAAGESCYCGNYNGDNDCGCCGHKCPGGYQCVLGLCMLK